jgi:hypothetical protein
LHKLHSVDNTACNLLQRQLAEVGQTSAPNESAKLQAVLETDASLLDVHR